VTDRKPVDDAKAEPEIVVSVIIGTYKAREVLASRLCFC
jgi:hypothetical protein